jgi:hypothetical protein
VRFKLEIRIPLSALAIAIDLRIANDLSSDIAFRTSAVESILWTFLVGLLLSL